MTEIANQDASIPLVERRMTTREIADGPAHAVVLRRRFGARIQEDPGSRGPRPGS